SSEVLSTVTLTVLGYEGIFEDQTIELRYGSTVYLTNSFAPVWANEEHTLKLIFTDAEGNELGSQIVLNDDILDENRNFTVKAVATEVVEVNFNINLAGINTVTAALAPDEALTPYDHEISGFKFIGWYNDEAMAHKVTAADEITNVINGVKTVYGKFIVETVTVNGVIYTFTADETEIGGSYAVTGYDAEKIAPFTAEGSWLILENELYSVPVTSIAEGAFAEGSLKNVVVPENIVTIGARAFLDNYNINSVVLLADSVHMQGTDKNTVFYGCSLSDGGKTTRLSVYYNAVTADAGNNWTYFRDGGKYIGRDGGGALYAGGNWSYTRFNLISGDGVDLTDSNFGFNTDGIKTSGMTAEQMKAEILKVLNNRTAADGVINEYLVTVDNGYANNGKMNTVNINIEVNEAPYYAVTVNADIAGSIIDGTIEIFNGAVFAQAGTTVSVLPPDGYEFDTIFADNVTLTEGDGGIYTYIMPDGKVTVNATCQKAAISTVTLNSAVAYSYDGLSYAANEQAVISGVEEGATVLSAPEAEGYVFLGWAYNNGTSLEFTSSTVQYSTYYAIWGVARDEISGVTPVTSGTDVNADISNVQVNQSYAHEFYKWYLDAGFNNEASVITIGNTVLYSRVIYTATVQFSLKSNMYIVYGDNDTSYVEKNSKTHTEYVYVLEGAVLNVAVKEENVYRLEIDSEIKVADIRVKQRNFVGNASGTKQLSVSCSDIDGWNVNTAYAVTGNLTFTFTSTF
ncbi:MAG: leucine-rich repeat domain-containing protein, partial [Clostridia bacterium]|nr:leucine-rich repeat domain-containing protein [Clostridia bacterium]